MSDAKTLHYNAIGNYPYQFACAISPVMARKGSA